MISANNLVYWLSHPLEKEYIQVLERVQDGIQPFHSDRFEVAYLISIECVEANLNKRTLVITEKGEEALKVFKEEL